MISWRRKDTETVDQLYAKGGELDRGADHHRAHRLVNAWEFAKLAKQAAELGRYVIAVRVFYPRPLARSHRRIRPEISTVYPRVSQ